MADPNVAPAKGFFGKIKRFFTGGEKRVETDPERHEETPSPTTGASKKLTVREAAWWIGGRSPGDGTEVYRQIMNGEITVVRSDGTIYGGGEL